MTIDLRHYLNREQSFIKHSFLTRYLQGAAYKIFLGRTKVFNFVDAFAGPWETNDKDNFSDASFDQAINTLEAVRSDLAARGVSGLRVRFCLCEKRPEAVARLRQYAAQRKEFEIHVFEGKFEDNLDGIAAKLPDGFTFTFIDPTGWDIQNDLVFGFLKNRAANGGEFLLNFMADHINRHAEYPGVVASIGRFLADPLWEPDFKALPQALSNQDKVLTLLERKMKARGVAKYLPNLAIMLPRQDRVKMRLVLGTFSAEGLEVFRDIQAKVEREEIEIRNNLRDGENPQISLFSTDDIAAMQQDTLGVGCKTNCNRAAELIVDALRKSEPIAFKTLAVEILESIPIRKTQLKTVVNEMKKAGRVTFDLPPRCKAPQEDTPIRLPANGSFGF
ncbi:three-Cys-motif partner protein TcmP [Tabrizicola sp.]|uniref:three-Cys-motif partner protein TcmP n=1 Tax=Tabrizicola sp. TaxID=2005166 RepID=UPI002733A671|nr:three-Cys-motif partner protein TcmP [Tabrizicola sp.]MDP3194149.1 three-Cys-motif partner protein TcmP [Tabrizicola sp.]MDZ4066151.1 three-Cys-motif partner protein TcmP [Tabrizicola sp.]